jgi:hypothetical protein
MRADRHGWLETLAESLRGDGLAVEVILELAWAPDLVSGAVLQSNAAFTALGVQRPAVRGRSGLTLLHQRVVRGTSCPMLTVSLRRSDPNSEPSRTPARDHPTLRGEALRGTR